VAAVAPGCNSEIYNPLDEKITSNTNYFDFAVVTVNLDCALVHLEYNWSRLAALKDKYCQKAAITDPGELGSVLVSSARRSIFEKATLDELQIVEGV
jgi:hypothetical protein